MTTTHRALVLLRLMVAAVVGAPGIPFVIVGAAIEAIGRGLQSLRKPFFRAAAIIVGE